MMPASSVAHPSSLRGPFVVDSWPLVEWMKGRQPATDRFWELLQQAESRRANVITAAKIKAKYKCSYADAFTAELAIETSCPVITGDKDFLKLEKDGILEVEWWGQ